MEIDFSLTHSVLQIYFFSGVNLYECIYFVGSLYPPTRTHRFHSQKYETLFFLQRNLFLLYCGPLQLNGINLLFLLFGAMIANSCQLS